MKLIQERKLDPSLFATHRFSLGDTEQAYDTFAAAAETHALKVVLTAEPVPALPAHVGATQAQPAGVS
jgi:alcohol dehydrogenase